MDIPFVCLSGRVEADVAKQEGHGEGRPVFNEASTFVPYDDTP